MGSMYIQGGGRPKGTPLRVVACLCQIPGARTLLQRRIVMIIKATPLTQRPAWKALDEHYQKVRNLHLRTLFAEDVKRGERFALDAVGIYFDYSKNRITEETLRLLFDLANSAGLRERVNAMFRGEKINITENRPVLHVALRAPKDQVILVDGK